MSQEKVERNKQNKANRKKINRSKKVKSLVAGVVTVVICIGVVFWIGFSVYNKQSEDPDAASGVSVDLSAVSDYINGISEE